MYCLDKAHRKEVRASTFPLRCHRCSLADDCRHTVCGTCQHSSTWMQRSSGESSWQLHYGTGLRFPGTVHGQRTPERWRQMPAQWHLPSERVQPRKRGANVSRLSSWMVHDLLGSAHMLQRPVPSFRHSSTRGLVVFSPQILSMFYWTLSIKLYNLHKI